jgi:hypothetical protein
MKMGTTRSLWHYDGALEFANGHPGLRHDPRRWLYNVLIERPLASLNYEHVYLTG